MNKENDPRFQKSRNAIYQAFDEMICEMPLEKINIKSLTERAGIHRKTFYLHYASVEELHEDVMARLANEYAKEYLKLPDPYTYYDLTGIFFRFCEKCKYSKSPGCDPYYTNFGKKLMEKGLHHNWTRYHHDSEHGQERQNIINAFIASSLTFSFRQWVLDGKRIPIEEAIQIVGSMLENGVAAIEKQAIKEE